MSQYPPPYAQPSGLPPKPRPRALWFVVGGVLVLLAPVVFVAALFLTLRPLTQTDALFPADGAAHKVSVDAGEKRAIFVPTDVANASCQVVDGTGRQRTLEPVLATYTTTNGGNEFTAIASFQSGDGELSVTCTSPESTTVRIGRVPTSGSLVAGIGIGIAAPLVLGGTGIIVLVVTGILYASRPPRTKS